MENSEKFCDECGLPFAEREELHGRIVLARKESEAAGSMMLDVQKESVALRIDREALARYVRAKNALRLTSDKYKAMEMAKEATEAYEALSQELRDEIEDGGEKTDQS